MGSVLTIIEQFGGNIKKASLNAITFAKILAEKLNTHYDIALIGYRIAGLSGALKRYGARTVYLIDSPVFEKYLAQLFSFAASELALAKGSDYICAVSSTFTRDFLPRTAARLNAGMVSETLGITSGTPLRFLRPMWAGNVIAEVMVTTPKAVFTVRGPEFAPPVETSQESAVENFPLSYDGSLLKVRYIDFAPTPSTRPDLGEASVVVAGGRGLKDAEGFKMLDKLADELNAAVGGTRAAVDAGLLSNDLQIGQTGRVIAPDLYIGVALSGAIQHLAGMKNSKVIVAINKDEEAPIFSVADYGLVADAFKAVPELVEQIKKIR